MNRDKLMDLLACLTGYVEMQWANGDRTAPNEHAKEARAILDHYYSAKLRKHAAAITTP